MRMLLVAWALLFFLPVASFAHDYPPPKAPAVRDGTGYVEIPGAAVAIEPTHAYKVIVDGISAAPTPTAVLPALGRASLMANAFEVAHVPAANRKIVLIFHGPAVEGLLRNEAYRTKFGVDNPNLKVIGQLLAAGAELFVCGQHMANHKLGIDELAPGIKLATAASIVLVAYQNAGYAVLPDK